MSPRLGRFRRRRDAHDDHDDDFDQYETLSGDGQVLPPPARTGRRRPQSTPPCPHRRQMSAATTRIGTHTSGTTMRRTGPSRRRPGRPCAIGWARAAGSGPGWPSASQGWWSRSSWWSSAAVCSRPSRACWRSSSLYEFYSLTAAWRPLRWAGYAGVIATVALAWALASADRGVLVGIAIGMGCVALAGLLVARRDDITGRMAVTAFGLVYVALPFGLLVATRQLPHGGGAVANVLVGTWVFDTASFVGGKLWGRRRIAPFVSPGKTLEGLITGVICGTGAVWIAGLYMSWISGWDSLIVGLVICAAGFVGDLFESMLKRDIGVKDSGRLLLGHGGVLDRFDALMFATVAAYFVTVALV